MQKAKTRCNNKHVIVVHIWFFMTIPDPKNRAGNVTCSAVRFTYIGKLREMTTNPIYSDNDKESNPNVTVKFVVKNG